MTDTTEHYWEDFKHYWVKLGYLLILDMHVPDVDIEMYSWDEDFKHLDSIISNNIVNQGNYIDITLDPVILQYVNPSATKLVYHWPLCTSNLPIITLAIQLWQVMLLERLKNLKTIEDLKQYTSS